jgi:hypothetical protein
MAEDESTAKEPKPATPHADMTTEEIAKEKAKGHQADRERLAEEYERDMKRAGLSV